ncbi:MAG: hypothetical protein GY705_30785, partial [Bacteroidetes bacterium]|nr:hypothetical protein [Bacteroidota bacterium]
MAYRSEQDKIEIAQQPPGNYPPPYGYNPQEDEISLIELWNVLSKRKYTILLVTAIVTIGAMLYALSAPSVYEAKVVFLPPSVSEIQALNIQYVQEISVKSVYNSFKRNLISRAPRQAVFDKMRLLEQLAREQDKDKRIEAISKTFTESISVIFPKQKEEEEYIPICTLALEGEDPNLIAEILNQVADETLHITANEIITNIQTKISSRKRDLYGEIELLRNKVKKQRMDEIERLENADALKRKVIEDQINTLRLSVKQKRLDRITILKEAASIAHSLGIK